MVGSARRHEKHSPIFYFGSLLILAGIGSAAFHGFPGPTTTRLHDVSLIGLLLLAAVSELNRRARPRWSSTWWWTSFSIAAVAVALKKEATTGLAIVLAIVAFGLVAAPSEWSQPNSQAAISTERRNALMLPIAVLAIGFGLYILSRTDMPLCAPESLLQGHAIWHLSVAAGVGLYSQTYRRLDSYSGVT